MKNTIILLLNYFESLNQYIGLEITSTLFAYKFLVSISRIVMMGNKLSYNLLEVFSDDSYLKGGKHECRHSKTGKRT